MRTTDLTITPLHWWNMILFTREMIKIWCLEPFLSWSSKMIFMGFSWSPSLLYLQPTIKTFLSNAQLKVHWIFGSSYLAFIEFIVLIGKMYQFSLRSILHYWLLRICSHNHLSFLPSYRLKYSSSPRSRNMYITCASGWVSFCDHKLSSSVKVLWFIFYLEFSFYQ